MTTPDELTFTDRMAHFYAREYGFPPVAGRVLGYLLICRPPQQTIAELSEALLASRSAITGAVTLLAGHRVVRRSRSAGQRVDHVTLDPRALDPTGFASATYQEQAALAREALELLEDGPSERRSMLEEGAAFYDFLAERMPALLSEWHVQRDTLRRRP
ncbi:GbsR/MarR family transcriptional regulator [Planotetraspora phitsanulokensis]|nr:MarR family transcriptional regulator [Planotetraspora phitsanulokensis]